MNQRWKNINEGMDQSEKILTWSVLSILGILLLMLTGWVAHLNLQLGKEVARVQSLEREREKAQGLKAKMDDIVMDVKISIRKIADIENAVMTECMQST